MAEMQPGPAEHRPDCTCWGCMRHRWDEWYAAQELARREERRRGGGGMSTPRVMWVSWCCLWSVLWAIAAFLQFGFNPICDLMIFVSAGAALIPVGKRYW